MSLGAHMRPSQRGGLILEVPIFVGHILNLVHFIFGDPGQPGNHARSQRYRNIGA